LEEMLKKLLLIALACVLLVAFAEDAGEAGKAAHDSFNSEERERLSKTQEQHKFQAEVNRLMDIIIHSLYGNREIFMRELVSNAADALDKIRYLSLTDKSLLGEGEHANLEIKLKFDKDAKTVSVRDTGIGMTKEDLVKRLGVVASSGTTDFVDAVAKGTDSLQLIGQFGVGFYSVYLVADKVTVISKNNKDDQYVWESEAQSTFTVAKDPRGNTLGRGTEVILHLKEDAEEFLTEASLEKIVNKYSSFINFPIYIWSSKTVEKEVPTDDEPADEEPAKTDDLEVGDEEDADKETKPKTKKVSETVSEWKRLNDAKAIWTRNPKEISDEEYTAFYEALTKDTNGPLTKIHFKAEGEISFKSILYVPKKADSNLYDKYYEKSTSLKLYVRRVLISDEFDNFLPRYMNFVKGVVDSDDLPLNVSRETLAQNRVLRVMAKKITRKVLEMLRKLADKGKSKKDDEEKEEEEEEEEGESKTTAEDYNTFWEQYGKSIKLGLIDDRVNKAKLIKLLRYQTSKSNGKWASLDDYVDRMKDKQKIIYYITGESIAAVENSPFMERLKKKDYEVIYMVDPLDEYVTSTLTEFDGNQLQSVTKADLKIDGDDTKRFDALKTEFKDFTEFLKNVYGEKVEKVTISNRVTSSPCVLVTGQYGWTANMERIMGAQTFADASKQQWMVPKKTMEINPRHPVIQALKAKSESDSKDPALQDLVNLLYDAALVQSGFAMKEKDTGDFAKRIHRVVSLGLNIDPSAETPEEAESAEPVAEEDGAAEETAADHDEL